MFLMPRRRSVIRLVRRIALLHPEFEHPITWESAIAVCDREQIVVRTMRLPESERGRLVRSECFTSVHLSRRLLERDRLSTLLHELGHYFAGDVSESCVFGDNDNDRSENEEFLNVFASYCCDVGAREFLDRREGAF
jgi:Zn-dependent peptidase ImmA (M78 family)